MPKINLYDELDQLQHSVNVEAGTTFADAAMQQWPKGFPDQTILVLAPDRTLVLEETACTVPMKDEEEWSIYLRPQGPAVGAFLLTTASIGGFSLGVTWATVALFAVSMIASYLLRPDLPSIGAQYEWDDSDRPQFLSGQSNKMRPGSRIPDVFGTVRVWPDLITEPWLRFQGDSQDLSELYVVSAGEVDIADPKLYNEVLETMPESAITVYRPGEPWPMDFPIIRTNAFVGSVALIGPNEAIPPDITFNTSGTIASGATGYFEAFRGLEDTFFRVDGVAAAVNNRNKIYRIVSIDTAGTVMTVSPAPETNQTVSDVQLKGCLYAAVNPALGSKDATFTTLGPWYPSTYLYFPYYAQSPYFWDVPDAPNGTVKPLGADGNVGSNIAYWESIGGNNHYGGYNYYPTFSGYLFRDGDVGTDGAVNATSIFQVPGVTTGASIDVEFPSGLYQQNAGSTPQPRAVSVSVFFREVGTSTFTEKTFIYTTATGVRTPRRFSSNITWVDEGLSASGEYELYVRRNTNFTPDTNDQVTVDACQLIGLKGIQDNSELADDFLNVTMVRLDISTQNAQQIQNQRSFNVIASRSLPDLINSDPNTLVKTNRLVDALMYTLVEGALYDLGDIDIASLVQINTDLAAISTEQAEFNGIVDQTLTADDQISLIASVGRITPYRRADKIYFSRLKAGLLPKTLINARNKIEPESRTMNFSMKNEPDAIIMRFLNAAQSYKEDQIQYPPSIVPVNATEQTLLGVTDANVATRLAQFLWDKRIYERDIIQVKTTEEGILLAPGDVIAVTDHLTAEVPIDGEIVAVNGTTFTFDQVIPAGTYVGRIRDSEGTMLAQGELTFLGLDSDVHTISAWAGASMPTSSTSQVGLLYSFTPLVDAANEMFYLTGIQPSADGSVELSGIMYSDLAYASDNAAMLRRASKVVKKRIM